MDILKHKSKTYTCGILMMLLCVVSIIVLLCGSQNMGNIASLTLLALLVLMAFMAFSMMLMGIKMVDTVIETEEDRMIETEDQYEQKVDDIIRDIDQRDFDLEKVASLVTKNEGWKMFAESLLSSLSKQVDMAIGIVYKAEKDDNGDVFNPVATYAYYSDQAPSSFRVGEGISGQVVLDKKSMMLNELSNKNMTIVSGLGESQVNNLAIVPILKDDNVVGLIEIATFKPLEKCVASKIDDLSKVIGNIAPL
ncbi:MAG: GAF domain-containing protein [Salinivirgaceae bacterium]|nr:GAF domain-containing protein [Salinivirgaceae bacterium]